MQGIDMENSSQGCDDKVRYGFCEGFLWRHYNKIIDIQMDCCFNKWCILNNCLFSLWPKTATELGWNRPNWAPFY